MATQHLTRRPALRFELLEDRAVPATLFVDDDKAQYKGNSTFTTIQAAVDAADAGDTIMVARGVYTEQVTFADDKDGITLRAQNSKQTIIRAPDTLTGLKAIVTVDGADDVTIRGFTITGPAGVANELTYGVVIDGGSATVRDNLITGIRNDPLDGVQTGVAVAVLGDLEAAAAVITDNTITDYQKGGVVVFGADATATVSGNTIVGAGPTDLIAQNGVQVSDGADGYVFENFITGNDYTGDEDVSAAGVYADTAGSVIVADNKVFENQTGVLLVNLEFVVVAGNRVYDNSQDGVDFVGVGGGLFADNRVEDNGVDGVYLGDTTNLVVTGNRIRNNGDNGLEVTDGSSGNVIFGNTLRGNAGFDAFDDTTGSRTAGTANFWFFNTIGTKSNSGLR
jgi:parallel beta-helix repeat protein